MPMCKVWNDNEYVHKEKFEDDLIVIEPKQCIKMDLEKAQSFLAKFTPIILDVNDLPDPKCFKKLRIERLEGQDAQAPEVPKYVFHKTGQVFQTKEEYEAAIDKFVDDLADPAEKEKRLKGVKGKSSGSAA